MEIILQYPIWFVGFCLLLGLIYATILYYKSNDFFDSSNHFKAIKKIMAALRFLSVSLLAFLLLSPFIKTRFIDKIKPIIVLAHDNSSSINFSFSKLDSTTYINNLNMLHQNISSKYDIDFYSFSNKLNKQDTLTFRDKKTNISKVLSTLNGNYFNRNVGAVILATDGIYNEGQNPFYTDFSFPIYFIAMGDTSPKKDLKITNIRSNKIAYLNDKVQIEIDVESYNYMGEKYKISVYRNTKDKKTLVKSKKLNIKKEFSEHNTKMVIDASATGIQRYTIQVSLLKDEITYENNYRDLYIDVIDSRQKILIIANAPHPDIAVLKQTISQNKNFIAKTHFIKDLNSNIQDYSLVILHQLPSRKHDVSTLFKTIKKEKIPYWIITGTSTEYELLNQIQEVINIKPSAENKNNANSYISENFNHFTIDLNTKIRLNRFPPVLVPFGDFTESATATTLLYQKIGSVKTDYPLLSFNDAFGVKSAIFVGDGLWRWKMHDFLDNHNHDAFNEIFSKTINFLAVKSDKRKFRVATTKSLFFEGEPVIIEAELYNNNYELINTAEVSLTVMNEQNEQFPLVFNRTSNAYNIKTSSLPIGNYTYIATTFYNSKKHIAKGAFSIKKVQLEAIQTQANHKLLYKLAQKTDGKVFYPNQLNELKEFIVNKEEIRPTLYESFKTKSIINLQWIFFLIMTLLSLEWFARKYFGGY